jgi:hypothetical protein
MSVPRFASWHSLERRPDDHLRDDRISVNGQDGENRMTNKTNNSLTPAASQPGRPPVRLKPRRINTNLAKAYPPDGESKVWWKRLQKALGSMSSDFVNASLLQLQAAAQLPCGGISETATNAAPFKWPARTPLLCRSWRGSGVAVAQSAE